MEQVLMQDVQRWVAPEPAWLVVREGALWVTRSGDIDDHVLARGERLAVARDDDLVVQSWRRDLPAVWDWQAQPALQRGALARSWSWSWSWAWAWAWSRAAVGLRGVAEAFAALARRAAARACRAEGSRNGA